jgi:hypothetical protein
MGLRRAVHPVDPASLHLSQSRQLTVQQPVQEQVTAPAGPSMQTSHVSQTCGAMHAQSGVEVRHSGAAVTQCVVKMAASEWTTHASDAALQTAQDSTYAHSEGKTQGP